MSWIECAKLMPPPGRLVLIAYSGGYRDLGEWCDYTNDPFATIPGEWSTWNGLGNPTHWAYMSRESVQKKIKEFSDQITIATNRLKQLQTA